VTVAQKTQRYRRYPSAYAFTHFTGERLETVEGAQWLEIRQIRIQAVETVEQSVQGDVRFHPCEMGTQTEVDSRAERHMAVRMPLGPKLFGRIEDFRIAVCGTQPEREDIPGPNPLPV